MKSVTTLGLTAKYDLDINVLKAKALAVKRKGYRYRMYLVHKRVVTKLPDITKTELDLFTEFIENVHTSS